MGTRPACILAQAMDLPETALTHLVLARMQSACVLKSFGARKASKDSSIIETCRSWHLFVSYATSFQTKALILGRHKDICTKAKCAPEQGTAQSTPPQRAPERNSSVPPTFSSDYQMAVSSGKSGTASRILALCITGSKNRVTWLYVASMPSNLFD
eukprot:scaffold35335_cov17-Tisochrysis_lutea.AAC.2